MVKAASLPPHWLDLVYDFHHIKGQAEVDRIIASGEWDRPGKFSGPIGGVLYTASVDSPPELEDKNVPALSLHQLEKLVTRNSHLSVKMVLSNLMLHQKRFHLQ